MKLIFKKKHQVIHREIKPKKAKKTKRIYFKKLNNFFKNMKIAPKLLLGFFLIASLGTGMGIYASVNLNQVSASGTKMYKEMLLPIRSINEMSDLYEVERISVRNLLISNDESKLIIYLSQITTAQKGLTETLKTVGSLISADAQPKLEELKIALADYDTVMNTAIAKIQAGDLESVSTDLIKVGDLYNAEKSVTKAISDMGYAVTTKAGLQNTTNKSNSDAVQRITYILIGLVVLFSLLIGINTARSISKPMNKLTKALKRLADGETDIPIENIDTKDEIGQIGNAFESILTSIKKLAEDTDVLILAATEGQLTVRADATQHHGAYQKIIEGFNETLDAVTLPVNEAAAVLGEVSKGNLSRQVSGDFKGDHAIIKDSLNNTIETLKELIADTDMMTEAAIEGRLTVRAETGKHKGAYRKIIEGFNATLDAVILPVNRAVQILQEVSKGNLGVTLDGEFKGDHAIIKNALNETITALKSYIGEISSTLGEISNGNLNQNITSEYLGDFVELKNSINKIADSLSEMLSEINAASRQMAIGTQQLSDGAQTISNGAAEQASAIEELTVSVERIAEQTKQSADNSQESNRMALAAKKAAAQGNDQMHEMLKSMQEINESSENISKIIKVIDDIAFQTNMLALNAAVEAARAGVHGKGFAVVAEEVRNLAARSASAAKETADLIEGSIKKVSSGTTIANGTADALINIVTSVNKAVELGEKIAVAANEQAAGIAEVNKGISQMSLVVQTNSATAQESAAASQELTGQAELLKDKIGAFKLKQSNEFIEKTETLYLGTEDILF